MKTLKFKTNLNCSSCVAAVKPYLDAVKNVEGWEVDTKNPEKILTVKGDDIAADNIIQNVTKAGYTIEEKKAY
jgi:copper chaperone